MCLLKIINITGLAFGFIGAFLVFINTPKIKSLTILHQREEIERLAKKDKFRNNMGKLGMFLIFLGFGFQLLANFI
jgi:hypothetical protein